jgi:carbamoyl-phosphate synthase/aspartate carbamoyltransferase/dihydroorotase/carbamoyl-phosphate synthase/aspartate carbamoyltransferase
MNTLAISNIKNQISKRMINKFFNKSLVTVESLMKEDIYFLFSKTDEMKKLVEERGGDSRLKEKILAALFYEPSSRTFSSFITAMQRLGGGVIPLNGMRNTSVDKGETLEDTARVFSSYADIIVLRHDKVGSAKIFTNYATVPVINAGDGSGEHPTQALLDAYTVSKHFESFAGLNVGLIGDLLYGRTVHSLAQILPKLGVKNFIFISPSSLRMPDEIGQKIKEEGGQFEETESLEKVMAKLDVIYMTRVQKERFADASAYEKVKNTYILDRKLLARVREKAVIMHPLPRVTEIHPSVDSDPRSLYFREQMRNGMYLRMALLDLILNE